jgi:hypothetical protein
MGLDNIIKNNPNWDNTVNSVYIDNNICKTMKEINKALEEDFKNGGKNNKYLKEQLEKNNINYKKISKREEEKKNKKKEEEKKNKKKFDNNKYLDLTYKIMFNILNYKNIFGRKIIQKIENMLIYC